MLIQPMLFEDFYHSERKKYEPKIEEFRILHNDIYLEYKKIKATKKIEQIVDNGVFQLPILIIGSLLPLFLFKENNIIDTILGLTMYIILFLTSYFVCFFIFKLKIEYLIIDALLFLKFKKRISYKNFKKLFHKDFDDYIRLSIDRNIKIDHNYFEKIINEETKITYIDKEKLINLKQQYIKEDGNVFTLYYFKIMVDYIFSVSK